MNHQVIPPRQAPLRARPSPYGDNRRTAICLRGVGALGTGLGVAGLAATLAPDVPPMRLFGLLLLSAGAAQLGCVALQRGWQGALIAELIGVIYLAAGLLLLVDPRGAQVPLLLILGGELLLVGLLHMETAVNHSASRGWTLPLTGGLITALLGAVVLSETGSRAFAVLTFAISVELLINAWSALFYAEAARLASRRRGPDGIVRGAA
jgi:uncharacterized membrane protein HdeD (DUF308 family)